MAPLSRRSSLDLTPRSRAAAWLVTGPVGHLVAGLLDWAELLGRWGWARARRREVRW